MNAKDISYAMSELNSKYIAEALDCKAGEQSAAAPVHRNRRPPLWRKLLTAAAVLVLMMCSGIVGSMASADTQETVACPDIGLTLILPDSWHGQYAMEKSGDEYLIYNPVIREAIGDDDWGGMLFYIMRWDGQWTQEQIDNEDGEWNFARHKYIMTTKDGTYLLYYASDLQFTEETADLYLQMTEEIKDIKFVIDNALD